MEDFRPPTLLPPTAQFRCPSAIEQVICRLGVEALAGGSADGLADDLCVGEAGVGGGGAYLRHRVPFL